MEINLNIVFTAVLALAVINILIFFLLNKRMATLETKSNAKIDEHSSQMKKEVSDLLQSMKTSLLDIKTAQSQQFEITNSKVEKQKEQLVLQQEVLSKATNQMIEKFANTNSAESKILSESINLGFTQSMQQIQASQKSLEGLVVTKFDELRKSTKQEIFANRQQELTNFEQLTKQVQMLRIENIVELTNSLGEHNELQVDTDDFIKYLGDCKVLKIEDKLTGQFTQINYENGVKRSSDTFLGDELKYQMFFDELGKAQRGIEFNDQNEVIFEYHYDQAGEINKRIEFIYDESSKETKQLETNY
ncbi:MAG: hypothetical protein KJ609_19340 [Gammaproteobacteria bacterium]|nr:hypothetical protein [Gammaproteobacteria bacterium]MBU2240550.1 hypothetical protein [Gammaproteobacteria bacterium]MBU2320706.1 hypothetical protein [Gammaproteobacteria bacterium]MBU2415049.1 hypothetical protein [Gammaproteobacteria bacterium]